MGNLYPILLVFYLFHNQSREQQPMQSEEQAIMKEIEAFSGAWNNGNAEQAASFFTEDAVRVGAFGDIQHGCAEIKKAYEKLLSQTMSGASVKQETGSVRMLSPELAVWQGAMEITPAGGKTALKGYVIQVMKKEKGRWLVLEAHPKLFPPAP